jgi:hypothetical protein
MSADPTAVLLTVVLGSVGLLVLAAVGSYVYAARVAAAEGRPLGGRPKKLGTKKMKAMVRKRGLQMPTD